MAFYKGRDGVVKIGPSQENIAHVQSWNIDEQADEVRGWGMGDDYENGFATVARWTGSVVVYMDPEDPAASINVRDEIAVDFYPGGEASGNQYFSGTAAILGLPKEGAKDGIPTLTINFTGRGPLTKSTVAV